MPEAVDKQETDYCCSLMIQFKLYQISTASSTGGGWLWSFGLNYSYLRKHFGYIKEYGDSWKFNSMNRIKQSSIEIIL